MAQLQSTSITGSLGLGNIPNTGSAGNVWFNTTTNRLQFSGFQSFWSAGGALITTRCFLAGAGTNTAALAFGGYTGGSPLTCTEAYNGTSWSTGGTMIQARRNLAGAGTSTAALAFGGAIPFIVACTEVYNGTSWSASSRLITARTSLAGAGTSTSALAFGGTIAPTFSANCTEVYVSGSMTLPVWTLDTPSSNSRNLGAAAGTNTAALVFGGLTPTVSATTETYNGTSWTSGGAMITARSQLAGAGTNTAALAFGGFTSVIV